MLIRAPEPYFVGAIVKVLIVAAVDVNVDKDVDVDSTGGFLGLQIIRKLVKSGVDRINGFLSSIINCNYST